MDGILIDAFHVGTSQAMLESQLLANVKMCCEDVEFVVCTVLVGCFGGATW